MRTLDLFLFIFIVALFSSCDKGESDNPLDFQLGESFKLAMGDTADCTCGLLSVVFVDILEDSRCPTSVQCIWPGRARIQLHVQVPDGQDTVELAMEGSGDEQARDTLSGFVFELLDVAPYPTTPGPIPDGDYRIELEVREL